MNNETISRIRKISQNHAYISLQMHETIAAEAGLSGTDHKYLGFLIERGKMTAGELSALTGLTTGAVTGLIDRLEKKEFVKRQFAAEDRRKVLIEPNTEKIMEIFVPLYREYRKLSEELTASFSNEEVEIIEIYLSKAIAIMSGITEQLGKNKK